MAHVEVTYTLTEAGQKASLLTGGDGKREQKIKIEATPELLAIAHVRHDGTAWISGFRDLDAPIPEPAADWVLRKLAEEEAAHKARAVAQAAEQAKDFADKVTLQTALVEAAEADPEKVTTEYSGRYTVPGKGTIDRTWSAGPPELKARIEQVCTLLDNIQKTRKEAKEQREREAVEAAESERARWIRAHGSERLKLGLSLNMLNKLNNVYEEERLALEFPNADGFDGGAWDDREILNPSEEALQTLAHVRKHDPDAKLISQRYKGTDDEFDEDVPPAWIPVVLFDPGAWTDRNARIVVR